MRRLPLPFRFALRELRGGLSGFRVFLGCLMLGVVAIAGVGSISAAVTAGLERDARSLLGGDVTLRLLHRPATEAQLAYVTKNSAGVSGSIEMRGMARAPDGEHRSLVQLKAVDDAYPVYGSLDLEPNLPREKLFGRIDGVPGAAVEDALLIRLDLKIGDQVKVGEGTFQIRAVVAHEPDRSVSAIDFGPRLLIGLEAMPDTQLVQPGSLAEYFYRVRLAPGVDSVAWREALDRDLPEVGWRIRDFRQAAPSVDRFVERISLFLTLVGLTALLVGGVGVGNAVRSYLEGKTTTIATLKAVGAGGDLIFQVYLIMVLGLGCAGIAVGLAIGALAPAVASSVLAKILPVPLAYGFYWKPLLQAGLFGLLTTLAFSLWPLGRAREVAAASLFRDVIAPGAGRPALVFQIATGVAVLCLSGLAILTAPERWIAIWFVFGSAASFVIFRLAASGLIAFARAASQSQRFRPRNPRLRLAIGNLTRPGAPTRSVVLSLGLGLTVLVIVSLIEGNLSQQISQRLPARAPSFFFIDLQSNQVEAFDKLLHDTPGMLEEKRVPSLRGRIIKLDGLPASQAKVNPDAAWALDSDRGLTYAAEKPVDAKVVQGDWWPADYKGPPLISFDANVAKGLGLKLGSKITINVLGRDIEATIANLREIDWSTMGINFTIIFAPGLLEAAPHTHIAVAYTTPAAELPLMRAVTDKFTNVSAIRVKDALEAINGILSAIAGAARVTAGVTLLAGVLVLAGAMVAGRQRRIYDAVVLKVLGATRRDLTAAFLIEYGLLGLSTAAIACGIGTIAAWGIVKFAMRAEFIFLPATVASTALLCAALTVCFGFIGTWRALGQKAAPILRSA